MEVIAFDAEDFIQTPIHDEDPFDPDFWFLRQAVSDVCPCTLFKEALQ